MIDPQFDAPFHVGVAFVEPALNQIRCNGTPHHIEPRVMQVLLCLAERPGEPRTRDQLLEAVWDDAYPHDEGLTQAVSKLRKALGDDARQPRFIETIPKVGYRLIAPVSEAVDEGSWKAESERSAVPPKRRGVAPAWRWATLALVGLMVAGGVWNASEPSPRMEQRVRVYHVPTPDARGSGEVRIVRRRIRVEDGQASVRRTMPPPAGP